MADPAPFVCPFCGATSHNPNDALNRYCGRCHVFVDDEEATYLAILDRRLRQHAAAYKAGADAWAAGKEFHESPHPFFSGSGLSWRMGWNDRALMRLADDSPGEVTDG